MHERLTQFREMGALIGTLVSTLFVLAWRLSVLVYKWRRFDAIEMPSKST
ncbi:MAG: hypothetical protein ACRYG5_08945 [Janthinobacterium lividum]